MKPNIRLGLLSYIIWLPGVVREHRPNEHQTYPILILFILLSCFLFAGSKRAFKIYRGLLWFAIIVSIMILLLQMSGQLRDITQEFTDLSSPGAAVAYLLFWMIVNSAILYYSEKDHVRAAYGLEPKKRAAKNNPEAEPEHIHP